jgi:CRP-like cAMP-binding protein
MAEKYSITKKEEVYNLLKNKRNFEYMSESLLRRLIDVMKVVRFREEKMLIKQGEENVYCYIIIKGSVSVYVDDQFLYQLRRTGDVFGEISFVTHQISTATIKAEKDLGVMVISFDFFNKVQNIELALWLARVIGEKLIRTSKLKSDSISTEVSVENIEANNICSIDNSAETETEEKPTEIEAEAVIEDESVEEIEVIEESDSLNEQQEDNHADQEIDLSEEKIAPDDNLENDSTDENPIDKESADDNIIDLDTDIP